MSVVGSDSCALDLGDLLLLLVVAMGVAEGRAHLALAAGPWRLLLLRVRSGSSVSSAR